MLLLIALTFTGRPKIKRLLFCTYFLIFCVSAYAQKDIKENYLFPGDPIIQNGGGLTGTNIASAKDVPNFPRPDGWSSFPGYAPGGSTKMLINYCYIFSGDPVYIQGTEFSFRANEKSQSDAACKNFMIYSFIAITGNDATEYGKGKEIANKKWQGPFGGHWYGRADNLDMEYLVLQTQEGARYGWYLIRDNPAARSGNEMDEGNPSKGFSEGVFGPPLKNLPKSGKATYTVNIGAGWRGWEHPKLQLVTVDFAKGELTIKSGPYNGGLNDAADRREIFSEVPLKFNPKDGLFGGKILTRKVDARSGKIENDSAWILGYIGGNNAETIYASMVMGPPPFIKTGIHYIIGSSK